MVVVLVLIFIISFIGMKHRERFCDNYLDIETTRAVNGLFVIIIFFSHLKIDMSPLVDWPLSSFCHTVLSQLMVVPFLFFSGFGVGEQFKKRGKEYLSYFPLNRILNVYCIYLVTVIVNSIICRTINWSDVFSWNNWYIFVILSQYLFTYLILSVVKKRKIAVSCSICFSIILSVMLILFEKHYSWYNTTITFSFGFYYSLYLKEINCFIFKKRNRLLTTILSGLIFILSFAILYIFQDLPIPLYLLLWYIKGLSFIGLIVLALYYFHFGNSLLAWFGKYAIWIYLLQFVFFEINSSIINVLAINKYLYSFVCFITTCIAAFISSYLFNLFWKNTVVKLIKKNYTLHDKGGS